MDSIMYAVVIALLIIGIMALFFILSMLDYKQIYYFESMEKHLLQEEPLKLRIPYYIWQGHKKEVIIQNTRDTVTLDNRSYLVTSSLTEELHVRNKNDVFPNFFYKDVVLTLKYIDESERVRTSINIFGDGNKIQIIEKTIIENLEEIVVYEGYDDDIRKQLRVLTDEIRICGINKDNSIKTINLLKKIYSIEPMMSIIASTISILSNFM